MLHAVIMAGGSGTRFWPWSRRAWPKQLLTLTGDRSLLQSAMDRCRPLIDANRIWVVTNHAQAEASLAQLPEISLTHVLREPCGRNTAPCIGWAAWKLWEQDPEAVMLVLPSDHVIQPIEVFQAAVKQGGKLIEEQPERLVLFGIPPSYPATGYGYIERGDVLSGGTFEVLRFREKPPREQAEEFLRSGKFFWNCGIFLWKARTILDELSLHQPEMYAGLERMAQLPRTMDEPTATAQVFPTLPSISIDHAVLEKASQVAVLEAPFAWDDVGSWPAWANLLEPDDQGNHVQGTHVGLSTKECIIRGERGHLIATSGVEGLLIVQTPDATLVVPKNDEQALRKLVAELEARGYGRYL